MRLWITASQIEAEVAKLTAEIQLRDEAIEQLRQICDAQRECIRVFQLGETLKGINLAAQIASLTKQIGS